MHELHKSDVNDGEVTKIEPYNPPKFDWTYYFQSHGCQICKIRGFNIDRKRGQDIASLVDTPRSLCSKSFWKSTKKVCYIFFMFTPTIIIAMDFM